MQCVPVDESSLVVLHRWGQGNVAKSSRLGHFFQTNVIDLKPSSVLCAFIPLHKDAYERLIVVCSASQLLLLHDSDIIMRVYIEMRQKRFSTVEAVFHILCQKRHK